MPQCGRHTSWASAHYVTCRWTTSNGATWSRVWMLHLINDYTLRRRSDHSSTWFLQPRHRTVMVLPKLPPLWSVLILRYMTCALHALSALTLWCGLVSVVLGQVVIIIFFFWNAMATPPTFMSFGKWFRIWQRNFEFGKYWQHGQFEILKLQWGSKK